MSLISQKSFRAACSRHLRFVCLLLPVLGLSTLLLASDWEKKVPDSDRAAANPLANDATAAAAGQKTYAAKCAKCHGPTGEGKGSHPSLRSQRVQDATPGELYWVISHGTGIHGMPSFGKLSDNERWQLVSYIKSLTGSTDQASH